MRAIETLYRGFKFRSRLEARYAVLFDELKFDWTYEPEGFHLNSGLYLPDFHITDVPFWLEVKGTRPTDQEVTLARELCETTHETVWLCDGDLMHFEADELRLRHQVLFWMPADEEILKRLRDEPDTTSNRIRLERIFLLGGEVSPLKDIFPGHIANYWQRSLIQVILAAEKMRQARFEFGDAEQQSAF